MKKALVLLLACLMAVNVSAQKAKSSSTTKKTTTTKTATKKSTSSKKSTDGSIHKGTIFFNTNATNISFNNISIGFNDDEGSVNQSITRFGLQGTGGYGLMDNLALVGGLGFQYGKYSDSALTAFTLNAGARYYIVSNFYASGMFVLGLTNVNNNTGKGGSKGAMNGHTFGIDIGVGYSFFLTPRIAIEPNLSYSIGLSSKMADADYKLNSLTANIGFTILL